MRAIDVSVIIVNYNTFELTCNCIESVIRHTTGITYEIVLVDNASHEADPGKFTERFRDIKLVRSNANLGFAGGNNLGIAASSGEFILLLNSDTLLTENSILFTWNEYGKLPKPGFAGVRTFYPDGNLQHTCERFPSIKNLLLRISYLMRLRDLTRPYSLLDRDFSPESVWGSYMYFSRTLLNAFAGNKLDERFFMYHEDILWCWQAKKAGYNNHFFAGTSIIHIFKGSQASAQVKSTMSAQFRDNYIKLEKIINGFWYRPVYKPLKSLVRMKERSLK